MRTIFAFVWLAILALPAHAVERQEMVDAIAALHVSTEQCAGVLTKKQVFSFSQTLQTADDAAWNVDIFSRSQELFRQADNWSDADRRAFCFTAEEIAVEFGLFGA